MTPFTASLGRSSQQVELSLLPFPASSAPSIEQAQAFDFLINMVTSHRSQFEFNEIASFLVKTVPGSNNAALNQTMTFGRQLRKEFFLCKNVCGNGMLFADMTPLTLADFPAEPNQRRAGIMHYVLCNHGVDANVVAPLGTTISITPCTTPFTLTLPQSSIFHDRAEQLFPDEAVALTPNRKLTTADITFRADGTPNIGRPEGTDILDDYTAEVLASLSKTKFQQLQRRQLSSRSVTTPPSQPTTTPPAQTVTTPVQRTSQAALLSPQLRNMFAGTSTKVMTYTGTYDFVDDQDAFNSTFPNPSFGDTEHLYGENAPSITIPKFIKTCQLEVLIQLMRIDYVGTASRSDPAVVNVLVIKFRALTMTNTPPAASDPKTPEDLFQAYLTLVPQLPDSASTWGMILPHQFHGALTVDCRANIAANDSYCLPDAATLRTKDEQLDALRKIRRIAVAAHARMQDSIAHQTAFLESYLKKSGIKRTSGHALSANTTTEGGKQVRFKDGDGTAGTSSPTAAKSLLSPAETVLRTNEARSPNTEQTGRLTPSVRTTSEEGTFPYNPTTNFQSQYELTFRGCLG